MAGETPQEAFDRGHTAGEIAEQLRRHDTHFAQINGSIDRTANALEGLRLDVQRLADQAEASAATVIATAAALKDAEDARRNVADQSWSPFARVFATVAALAAVASVVGLLLAR